MTLTKKVDEMAIREVKRSNGEIWFFVKVELDGFYYGSKTLPTRTAAKAYRDKMYQRIATGELLPASKRRIEAKRTAAIEEPFRKAVAAFLENPPRKYRSKGALNTFRRLAVHFGDKPMREFAGESGRALLADYVSTKLSKTSGRTNRTFAPATVRKEYYAILKVLQWYKANKLRGVTFEFPRFEAGDGFKVPASHSNKRKRKPSVEEWDALQRSLAGDQVGFAKPLHGGVGQARIGGQRPSR